MRRILVTAPTMRAIISAVLHAASQFWVVSLLAHFTAPESLGHYVLGYAVCAPLFMLLGARQRIVLANDVGGHDRSWHFIHYRICASALMVVAIALFAVIFTSPDKALVIALVAMVKAAESLSDICYGSLQRNGQMPVALRAIWQRAIWTILTAAAVIPLAQSAAAAAAALLMVWAVQAAKDLRRVHRINPRPAKFSGTISLYDSARYLPTLGMTAMLASLAYYVPRYFISATGTDSNLGYYGAISYFGLAMLMLAHAITDVAMPGIARKHRAALRSRHYLASLRQLYALLAGAAALALSLTAVAGAPMLRLLFGDAYSAYTTECLLLLAAGSFAALNACQAHAVVALQLNRQQTHVAGLCFAALVAMSAVLVPRWGILGAALADLGYAALYFVAIEYYIVRRVKST